MSPIGDELIEKDSNFPLTLIYGNLSRIAEWFVHFSNILGPLQHEPKGAVPVDKNRMFSQLHAQCSDHERESTVLELVEGKSKLRLFFVTVAFGLYVDVSNITRVIHIEFLTHWSYIYKKLEGVAEMGCKEMQSSIKVRMTALLQKRNMSWSMRAAQTLEIQGRTQ